MKTIGPIDYNKTSAVSVNDQISAPPAPTPKHQHVEFSLSLSLYIYIYILQHNVDIWITTPLLHLDYNTTSTDTLYMLLSSIRADFPLIT